MSGGLWRDPAGQGAQSPDGGGGHLCGSDTFGVHSVPELGTAGQEATPNSLNFSREFPEVLLKGLLALEKFGQKTSRPCLLEAGWAPHQCLL